MPLLRAHSRCSATVAGYRTSVGVLSREQFDAIEFDAVRSGDHASAAELMSRLAATAQESAGMPRAEAFLRAGEQYLLADDPAAAVSGFRRAMMDGGPVFADPRVPLARALFQLGRHPEAQALITRLKTESPQDPRVYDLVAELLMERGDLQGALWWATKGVDLGLGRAAEAQEAGGQNGAGSPPPQDKEDAAELRLLLSLRYRIRNDLGLAEDEYDRLLDEK
jgi:tetratricopeptide (TPR) repeat protein